MEFENDIIKLGDKVLLMKDTNIFVAKIQGNMKVTVDRQVFHLLGAVGHPYGTTFESVGNSIRPVVEAANIGNIIAESKEQTKDNRHIRDTSDSQKLSRDEIEELRKQGEKGEEVVRQLIQNSTTFQEKTEYSKEKYIKKKTKKHVNIVRIVRPTTRLIAQMYFLKGAARINYLRIDALSQMLAYGDVKANNRQLVVESCNGLLLAATVERMGGHGIIIQIHAEQEPPKHAMEAFNFNENHHNMVHCFPLKMLGTIGNEEETKTLQQTVSTTLNSSPVDEDEPSIKKARMEAVEDNHTANTVLVEGQTCCEMLQEATDQNMEQTEYSTIPTETDDAEDVKLPVLSDGSNKTEDAKLPSSIDVSNSTLDEKLLNLTENSHSTDNKKLPIETSDPNSIEAEKLAKETGDPNSTEDEKLSKETCDPNSIEDEKLAKETCDPNSNEDEKLAKETCDPNSNEDQKLNDKIGDSNSSEGKLPGLVGDTKLPAPDGDVESMITDVTDVLSNTNENDKPDSSKKKNNKSSPTMTQHELRREKRAQELQRTRRILEDGKFDSLLISCRVHPTPIVVRLLPMLSDSRPCVVFCPYQEPLIDCYQRLRDSGSVVHLHLTETWLRNYQVLSNRTHPEINMNMNGGYLLSFIKVNNQPPPSSTGYKPKCYN